MRVFSETCTLTRENFEEVSHTLERKLSQTKADRREILSAIMLAEEISSRFFEKEEAPLSLEVQKNLGDISFHLFRAGEAFNPLEESPFPEDDDQDIFRERILRANRSRLSYSRRRGADHVYIQIHAAANRQIRFTLAAMLLGILVGLLLRWLAPESVQNFINSKILLNIRAVFLNALKMMVAPLVFFSVTASLSHMTNTRQLGKAGGRILLSYFLTSLAAAGLGVGLFYLFFHGSVPPLPADLSAAAGGTPMDIDILSLLTGIVPSDLVSPVLQMNMLQVLFVAIIFGIAMSALGEKIASIRRIVIEADLLCVRVVSLIVRFLPLIAFVAVTSLILKVGLSTLSALIYILLGHVLGVLAMMLIYGLMIRLGGRVSPRPFYRKAASFVTVPFTLNSSNACIPFTMDFCTKKLGVSPQLCAFSIPIGSTINMDGGCFSIVFQGLLLAKMYGIAITPGLILTVILTAVLVTVGAPGVAGSAYICLTTIVVTMGLPAELATIVLGIDSLLSMFRITNNVIGDTAVTLAVAASEGQLDRRIYEK
ncbi:MAG: dicarboxylate/amino acid:cation symporter [Lachnospiraceae bacterium]|nr:dicarboxylate/amino acid:cation symporter [Lachnospiraceae bacterium]